MKIYAYSRNGKIDELDPFIGQDIWIPVGWEDDFYGWVNILRKNGSHYKAKLFPLYAFDIVKKHLRDGHSVDWRDYIEDDYTFPATHFEIVNIDQAVTDDELEEEIESRYGAEIYRIEQLMKGNL